MLSLTDLEQAVLREICDQYPEHKAVLAAQLAAAVVSNRKNTGAGFYTYLDVDRSVASPSKCDRVIGEVWVRIPGFRNLATFLLFLEGGYVSCLECATVGDDTTGADPQTFKFEIVRPK